MVGDLYFIRIFKDRESWQVNRKDKSISIRGTHVSKDRCLTPHFGINILLTYKAEILIVQYGEAMSLRKN
jgi:hypothetical protein